MTLRDLTRLEAKLDDALNEFAKPGDMPQYTTADMAAAAKKRDPMYLRSKRARAGDYGVARDIAWDTVGSNPTPARKGLSKELSNTLKAKTNRPAVWSAPKNLGSILRRHASKRLAGPLKKLP